MAYTRDSWKENIFPSTCEYYEESIEDKGQFGIDLISLNGIQLMKQQ